jgi:hypothetical protein
MYFWILATAKLFLKASARHRKNQDFTAQESTSLTSFKSKLLTVVSKLLFEGSRSPNAYTHGETKKNLKQADGDSNAYAKERIAKRKKEIGDSDVNKAKAELKGLAQKHGIEPKRDRVTGEEGNITRGALRADTLGHAGAGKGVKNTPAGPVVPIKSPRNNEPESHSKRSDGNKSKPLPLNLKGRPRPGKKVLNVRAKSVNTSRSTGQEGAKAQANLDSFDKFYKKLSTSKKQ